MTTLVRAAAWTVVHLLAWTSLACDPAPTVKPVAGGGGGREQPDEQPMSDDHPAKPAESATETSEKEKEKEKEEKPDPVAPKEDGPTDEQPGTPCDLDGSASLGEEAQCLKEMAAAIAQLVEARAAAATRDDLMAIASQMVNSASLLVDLDLDQPATSSELQAYHIVRAYSLAGILRSQVSRLDTAGRADAGLAAEISSRHGAFVTALESFRTKLSVN